MGYNRRKILSSFVFTLLWTLYIISFLDTASASRSIQVISLEGEAVGSYKNSYALLIGVSDYTAGWPDLDQIPKELKQVEAVLKKQGFNVTKTLDPDAVTMESAFKNFIDAHGYTADNRLLFFFSGHGHTLDDGRKGFLVPTDAPKPGMDLIGFKRKALDMNQILSWCRQMDAHHALFLFDSCFSGAIFTQKSLPEVPRHITRLTAKPVRQFITAGSAKESVPSVSIFTPAFVDAIAHELGDLNKDGYISGTELGLYLQRQVPRHNPDQTPQYGKINDRHLAQGDFIFKCNQTVLPTGSVGITSDPAGARIFMNGIFKGVSPVTLSGISPGNHLITARLDGFPAREEKTIVHGNRKALVHFQLESAKKKFSLHVTPMPADARIQIVDPAITYHDGILLSPGRYNIEVSRPGYETQSKWFHVKSPENIDIYIHLKPEKAPEFKKWTEPHTGITFIWIPGGCFTMGSATGHADEKPPHEICLDGFWMGQNEISNAQYRKYTPGHNNKFYKGESLSKDNQPVVYVSWEDVQGFIKWLNKKTGKVFALPTEAQWEYACRAGTTTATFWGDDPNQACSYANISEDPSPGTWGEKPVRTCKDGFHATSETGFFQNNRFGLYDMLGNVWEWCRDTYAEDAYTLHAPENPVHINQSGMFKVFRGGGFNSTATGIRCADRDGGAPNHRYFNLGFRLTRHD